MMCPVVFFVGGVGMLKFLLAMRPASSPYIQKGQGQS